MKYSLQVFYLIYLNLYCSHNPMNVLFAQRLFYFALLTVASRTSFLDYSQNTYLMPFDILLPTDCPLGL